MDLSRHEKSGAEGMAPSLTADAVESAMVRILSQPFMIEFLTKKLVEEFVPS